MAHRVLANSSNEPRISVAFFFNPGKKEDVDLYGPLLELISPENPACYRNLKMSDHSKLFLGKAVTCNCITQHFKLP